MPKLTIKTDGYDAFKERVLSRARALDRDESLPAYDIISFSSVQHMMRALTPKRVALLEQLTVHGSQPVNLLARDLKRTKKAVQRDVLLLRQLGAVRTGSRQHGKVKETMVHPLASKLEFVCTVTARTEMPKEVSV